MGTYYLGYLRHLNQDEWKKRIKASKEGRVIVNDWHVLFSFYLFFFLFGTSRSKEDYKKKPRIISRLGRESSVPVVVYRSTYLGGSVESALVASGEDCKIIITYTGRGPEKGRRVGDGMGWTDLTTCRSQVAGRKGLTYY